MKAILLIMIPNKKHKRRRSLQRTRILQIIEASGDHPTAKEVHTRLLQEDPSASLGNVYRNIRILIEEGEVFSRDFDDGIEHFDAVSRPHYHFICTECGRVEDIPLPVNGRILEDAQRVTDHTVLSHTVQFKGICSSCRAKQSDTRKDRREHPHIPGR
jgi:Fur family transcriptional regulator, peroxide stress response regulator